MPFTRPTLQQIIDRIESDFTTRISGSSSLLRRSVLKVMARVYGGAVHLLYGFLDFQSKQFFATTADSTGLDIIGNEFGLARESASSATGTGAGTGANGKVITAGSVLVSGDDNRYTVDTDATIASGTATVNFTAETANSDSNDSAGITLTFVNPIAGISTAVTVDSNGITGGQDEETDDDYRERILQRKRQAPHGGNEVDYEVWAEEVAGVTRSWSFPSYNGRGTIGLTFVRDNDASIIPSQSELDEVEDYIISHDDPATGKAVGIPVTAQPGLFVFAPLELSVDFEIQINPNSTSVQTAVTNELTDLLLRDGGAGETVFISRIGEAISLATGEIRHVLISPVADIATNNEQVHVLGSVTFTTLS
jgi:uncharacterized phage protein gp47/JayE